LGLATLTKSGRRMMWRISYETMSLEDILIMAYMNSLQAELHEGLYSSEFKRIMETIAI
jgi:hypothetical protein